MIDATNHGRRYKINGLFEQMYHSIYEVQTFLINVLFKN